jgi:hypothetical protein
MSGYNGVGQFSFTYNWVNDAANGIPITASRMDSQFNDATNGFDLVICRDGQSTTTAPIPFAQGITIGNGNGTLSIYDQGSFTPILGGSIGNPTVTYSVQKGSYTKIGNRVFAEIEISITGYTGGSGNLQIGNMPFPSSSTSARGAGTAVYNGLSASGTAYSASIEILNNSSAFNAALISMGGGNFVNAQVSDMASNFAIRSTLNYAVA